MVQKLTDSKWIAGQIGGDDAVGRDISVSVDTDNGFEHVRGEVVDAGHNRLDCLSDDGQSFTVEATYHGDADDHHRTEADDWEVEYITAAETGGQNRRPVVAFADWDTGDEPELTLEEAADKDLPASADEARDELSETITLLNRALTELQTMRNETEQVLDNEQPTVALEETIVKMEMERGGKLAIDEL